MFFEYEIASDTLSFTEVFREIFGKESVITGFRKRLETTKMVHPEELPAVISIFHSFMKGRKQVRFEVRLIPRNGKPTWYLCYASMIFDENRNPYKVVGKFSVTNPATIVAEEKPVYQPQMDGLTNVCNKESIEYMVEDAAKNQSSEEISALLLVEFKNFKGLNEMRKSIGGKNVLIELSELLKGQIRTTDIIGRTGMGEFAIYLKNLSGDQVVYQKADAICKGIEEKYTYSYSKHSLFANIGITLHKGPQSYQTLYHNATLALTLAKKAPTSSFEVYGGSANS